MKIQSKSHSFIKKLCLYIPTSLTEFFVVTEHIESKMITTFLLYTPIKSNTSLNKFFSVVGVTCTNLLKARKASKNFCLYLLTESMTPLNVEVGVINLLKAWEVE